jgi:hypothetical protein
MLHREMKREKSLQNLVNRKQKADEVNATAAAAAMTPDKLFPCPVVGCCRMFQRQKDLSRHEDEYRRQCGISQTKNTKGSFSLTSDGVCGR